MSERYHRDGAMVYYSDGPDPDDSHFVADAATEDDAERFVESLNGLTRERDLAVAHDRQPYPTAWAYEQACRARDEAKARAVARVTEVVQDLTAEELRDVLALRPDLRRRVDAVMRAALGPIR